MNYVNRMSLYLAQPEASPLTHELTKRLDESRGSVEFLEQHNERLINHVAEQAETIKRLQAANERLRQNWYSFADVAIAAVVGLLLGIELTALYFKCFG